ncbi:MAG: FAD-dependent 5-carboxymethylaminomethyl-2-thiouridine(34) oxidoreductase MnmC [Parvularculaceae bacterium]
MLTARKTAPPSADAARQPWFPRGAAQRAGARVAVIGAGVAGASLARALHRRGCTPVLIDGGGLANGASGNPAGLIMPRLDLGGGAAARFFLAAYLHALRTIDAVQTETGETFFRAIGVTLKARDEAEAQKQNKLLDARILPPEYIETCTDGLYFPQAGVIDPRAYCRALAGDAPLIENNAARAERVGDAWRIHFAGGGHDMFDAFVLANGRNALRFEQARSIPLGATMGQIDYFPGDVRNDFPGAEAPDQAVAAGPYFAPAPSGGVVIGATYEKIGADDEAVSTPATSATNLAAIAEIAPELAARLQTLSPRPRAAIRCQTPDRLPVAGVLVDWGFYAGAYDGLRTGRASDYPPGETMDGAFILAGLGSRGLVTAPLCAALIAADISGAPSPVERDIAEALHPARFFIRDLKRARKVRAN